MLIQARVIADRACAAIAAVLLGALLATVLAGVVTRALDDPFIWTDEVSRLLMVWLAVFGWILACRGRGHIRVRFFRDLLPPRAWRVAEIILQLAVALFGALIMWFGYALIIRNIDLEATTVPLSMAWMYAPISLAGMVTAAQAIGEIGELLRPSRSGPAIGVGRAA
jgi:TRAP-type C4-dicarboxylate transport system permease small subunit